MDPKVIFSNGINTLQNRLVEISNHIFDYSKYFNNWHNNENAEDPHVFQRNCKLSLPSVFWLIVSRIANTLPVALDNFFGQLNLPVPGKSAFSQKRKLIKSEFFSDMNKTLVEGYYKQGKYRTWKGYVVMACDGSRIALPDVEELGEEFGYYHNTKGEQLYPCAKAALFQDNLNNITVLAEIVHKNTDEKYSFERMFAEANDLAGGKSIIDIDRGYFSYLLIFKMIISDQFFIMKAKTTPWARAFLNSGKKDMTIRITPSRATSIYSDEEWRKRKDKTLEVRLVRSENKDGHACVLITNINRATASAKEIVELYRLRWPVETAYGVYKNDMALELFSTFRIDGIKQDFFAALLLYNLSSMLAMGCGYRKKKKPDMNIAVGLVHNLCPTLAKGSSEEQKRRIRQIRNEIGMYASYVILGRSFSRKRHLRKTSGKFFRDTNFSAAV